MRKYHRPVAITALVSLIAIVLIDYLLTHRPEQCPEGITQAQLHATNCIIGADIGTGVGIILVGLTWFMTFLGMVVWLAIGHFMRRKA